MKLKNYIRIHLKKQGRFAELLGVSESTVSSWISGRRTPTLKMARKISIVTKGKVKPEDFYDD